MSTPPPVSHTALPSFARSAAATFSALASQATALGMPGGVAVAHQLSAGAVELAALVGDAALSGVFVTLGSSSADLTDNGPARLLATPLLLQEAVTVAVTAAAAAHPPVPTVTVSRLIEVAMVSARRLAGLRMAAALATSGQLPLLDTSVLTGIAAVGAVGSPNAFAPVVVS